MDCRIPPPLSDDQLSSALDGDADTEVQEHLTACPSCTARLEQARRIEQGLRKLAFWDCPSPEELGEYELAMLDTAASQAVAAHLGGCGRCRAELEDLRALLGTPEPAARPAVPAAAPRPTPLRARLGELIARLLPVPAAPALALRGAASRTLTAEAGDLTLMLDMTDAGQGVRIEGQLIGDALDPWLGAVVELRQGGALQSAALVDEFGGFSLGPLPAAPADLRITGEHGGTILLKYEV
jgi:hypothetical protein